LKNDIEGLLFLEDNIKIEYENFAEMIAKFNEKKKTQSHKFLKSNGIPKAKKSQ
jgi:hypothetical protein